MRDKAKDIVIGLLTGIAVGAAAEGLAGLAGSVRGGAEGALHWAKIVGLLLGVVGIWLVFRRVLRAEGPAIYRPGRTALELENEVREESRRYEKTMRESDGEEHRMPRRRSGTTLWMDVGLVISGLLPVLLL